MTWKGRESYQKQLSLPNIKSTGPLRAMPNFSREAAKAGVSLYTLVAQKLKSTTPVVQEGVDG